MAGELLFITGATGFVGFAVLLEALKAGYRVRISIRRASQADDIKHHALIAPFTSKLDFVIVPDITADGAFDTALEGVTFIEHIASPLPKPTEDPENDIILPAIRGTTSILNSALKHSSIRKVVITSSIMAIVSDADASIGSSNVFTPNTRVSPFPTKPWGGNPGSYYRAAKALALDATDKFIVSQKPGFGIVNVMPGYVVGPNELVTSSKGLVTGSNALILNILIGVEPLPGKRPYMVSDLRDVARVHVEALEVEGNASFLLDAESGKEFDDAKAIVRKHFPEKVADGTLALSGSVETARIQVDSSATLKTFGKLHSYEEAVVSLVEQYLKLKGRE